MLDIDIAAKHGWIRCELWLCILFWRFFGKLFCFRYIWNTSRKKWILVYLNIWVVPLHCNITNAHKHWIICMNHSLYYDHKYMIHWQVFSQWNCIAFDHQYLKEWGHALGMETHVLTTQMVCYPLVTQQSDFWENMSLL